MRSSSLHFIGISNSNGNASCFGHIKTEDGDSLEVRFVLEDASIAEVREAITEKLGWTRNKNGSATRKGKGINCLAWEVEGAMYLGDDGEELICSVQSFKIPKQTRKRVEEANAMGSSELTTTGEVKW